MNLKQTGRYLLDLRDSNKKRPILTAGRISYANWWKMNPETCWFTAYIRHYFPDLRRSIRFYSVFGPVGQVREDFDGVKIFFSGENLEPEIPHPELHTREVSEKLAQNRRKNYGDYAAGRVQISLGFAESSAACRENHTTYLRFPLWITYLVRPEDDYETIMRRIHAVNQSANGADAHGVTCISSHDFFGTRADICDGLEAAGIPVAYAGNWRHNTDSLRKEFGDDKNAYLHSVRFHVCPENLDAPGYVTEKLFDAFAAGTIPVYQGAGGHPEKKLINPDAVLFWDYGSDHQKAVEQIRQLEEDDSACADFLHQVKLYDACADYVWERMQELRKLLTILLS